MWRNPGLPVLAMTPSVTPQWSSRHRPSPFPQPPPPRFHDATRSSGSRSRASWALGCTMESSTAVMHASRELTMAFFSLWRARFESSLSAAFIRQAGAGRPGRDAGGGGAVAPIVMGCGVMRAGGGRARGRRPWRCRVGRWRTRSSRPPVHHAAVDKGQCNPCWCSVDAAHNRHRGHQSGCMECGMEVPAHCQCDDVEVDSWSVS